jgi:hypothetical protein
MINFLRDAVHQPACTRSLCHEWIGSTRGHCGARAAQAKTRGSRPAKQIQFGDIAAFEMIPSSALVDAREESPAVRGLQGTIVAPKTGDYQFQTYSNGTTKLWLNGVLQIDHDKQNWATEYDQFKVHLDAGKRYPINVRNWPGAPAVAKVRDHEDVGAARPSAGQDEDRRDNRANRTVHGATA